MKESASTLNKINDDHDDGKQSCSCCCCFIWFFKIIIGFVLYYLWAVISLFLFSSAIFVFIASIQISIVVTICTGLFVYCCDSSSSGEIIHCIGYGLAKSLISLILPGFNKINSCIFEK